MHSYNNSAAQNRSSTVDFFLAHPILPVLRSVFFSSILWIFLAFALYGIYTLIVGH
jgi:hypothetical protein